jgi:hypothetical protein
MGKFYILLVAAVVLANAPLASAGTFDVLASASAVRTDASRYLAPGTIVKAEFKSSLQGGSDMELTSDNLLPEPRSAQNSPKVQTRPAVAFKERRAGAMAPPPAMAQAAKQRPAVNSQSPKPIEDLESELEKDLVIERPPAKAEEAYGIGTQRSLDTELPSLKTTKPKKASVKKKAVRSHRAPAQRGGYYASADKTIVKVRPLSRTPWGIPAGNYSGRACPVNPEPATASPRTIMIPPAYSERVVRNGVTVKLAPRPMHATYQEPEEESGAADLISAATEIIGLPFAFVSSFF